MPELWTSCVDWLTQHAVVPFLALIHLDGLAGDPREIAAALLVALAQVLVIGLVFRPLETLAPAERWRDRRLTRIDRTYTLVMLLGLNPLFAYLVLMPLANWAGGGADVAGTDAAASGLADVHAAAVSIGQLAATATIPLADARLALAVAFVTNSVMKCVAALGGGGADYARALVGGVLLIDVALVAALWLS